MVSFRHEHHDNRQQRGQHADKRLADHLLQRIRIVREQRHRGTMLRLVVIRNRQMLQLLEHAVPDAHQRILGDRHHDPGVYIDADDAKEHYHGPAHHGHGKGREVHHLSRQQGRYVLVYERLDHVGHEDRDHGRYDDAHDDDGKLEPIASEHLSEEAEERLPAMLDRGSATHSPIHRTWHLNLLQAVRVQATGRPRCVRGAPHAYRCPGRFRWPL